MREFKLKKEEPSFRVEEKFYEDLESNNISEELRTLFSEQGVPLSERAIVKKEDVKINKSINPENVWLIFDVGNRIWFIVRKGQDKLDIFLGGTDSLSSIFAMGGCISGLILLIAPTLAGLLVLLVFGIIWAIIQKLTGWNVQFLNSAPNWFFGIIIFGTAVFVYVVLIWERIQHTKFLIGEAENPK